MKEMNKKEENRRFSQCNFSPKNRNRRIENSSSAIFPLKNSRGVSPVIATVLLIGLVIALGAVVFVWFQSFTHEAVTKFEGENIELVCGDVQFEASYLGGNLALSNTGNVPIYSFNVQINNAGGAYTTEEIVNLVSNWPTVGLRSAGVFSGNIAGSVSDETTQIILIPILRGTVSSGDQRSFTCGSQYGQSISIA